MDKQNDDNFENVGLGCALEMFTEVDEVLEMISNLSNIYTKEKALEKAYERFLFILDQYNEQPHLLDRHLDKILQLLITFVRNQKNPIKLKHEVFKYMYIIIKVRGYKVVVRHLPHEVADFEPVLNLLENQDPNNSETWQTRYVLLIWMSIIVLIPFHMSRLDGFENGTNGGKTVMERVLDVCKTYAIVSDKCRDAAAFLTSRFLTRSDVKDKHLEPFLVWAIEVTTDIDVSVFTKYGALSCVATILKHGKREDLLPHAPQLLDWIVNTDYKNSTDRLVLKLSIKIIQRIGLVFLRARVTSWRYRRGNRSLAENLSSGDNCTPNLLPRAESSTSKTQSEENSEDDIDVPEELEIIIDELVNGLRNSDSVVRWSAAKGIGRVTGRLPRELADEVVGSVLELFNPREGDGAWHGGCLALAELGRRGLLLPQRLNEVVPLILRALVYDEPRGYASVGSHIRDAACYVCWAFARAYDTDVLKPFVPSIASALVVVSVFDREINCRRAAAAAFQENVGRQGTFPHGIDILTAADFFTVGVRTNAYLSISVYIAQFPEYTLSLINHLIDKKVDHWDSVIRELSAKALHNLTCKAVDYMATTVLIKLVEKTRSIDLNARHGSVISIGEILHCLSDICKTENVSLQSKISCDILETIKDLVPRFRERQYFRGLGGELMKQACADFIEKCSLAQLPVHGQPIIDDWINLLDECLSHEVPNIREKAIIALPALFNEYLKQDNVTLENNIEDVVKRYTEQVQGDTEVIRMGYALALGSLPSFMLAPHIDTVIPALKKCAQITDKTSKWAMSRRDAIKALMFVCKTTGIAVCRKHIHSVYDCFLNGLLEYTLDSRGDIGAWVRESSMVALQSVTLLLAKEDPSLLTSDLVTKVMISVAKQAVEKIDRTRALGGKTFYNILHSKLIVPNIPNRDELLVIFPSDECDSLNWNSAAETFPRFVNLLAMPIYTYNIMLGLIVSVGGLTEGLVKHSSASLFDFLKSIDESKKHSEVARYCDTIVKIFAEHQHVDRVTGPLFSFLDRLFNSGCIRTVLEDPQSMFATEIFNLLRIEITNCRDTYKLIDSINVLCQLIQVPSDVCSKSLVRLSMLLCHPQKYVRKSTQSKFYEALLMYGDNSTIPLESLDEAMSLLSETNWEESVESIKPVRNQLCLLMGVKAPVARPKKDD